MEATKLIWSRRHYLLTPYYALRIWLESYWVMGVCNTWAVCWHFALGEVRYNVSKTLEQKKEI